MAAKDKVLDGQSKKINTLQTELAKLKNLPADKQTELQTEQDITALHELHNRGLTALGSFNAFLAQAQAILQKDECSRYAKEQAQELCSSLCVTFGEEMLDAGIQIDFRLLTYPPTIMDSPLVKALRGDAEAENQDNTEA